MCAALNKTAITPFWYCCVNHPIRHSYHLPFAADRNFFARKAALMVFCSWDTWLPGLYSNCSVIRLEVSHEQRMSAWSLPWNLYSLHSPKHILVHAFRCYCCMWVIDWCGWNVDGRLFGHVLHNSSIWHMKHDWCLSGWKKEPSTGCEPLKCDPMIMLHHTRFDCIGSSQRRYFERHVATNVITRTIYCTFYMLFDFQENQLEIDNIVW